MLGLYVFPFWPWLIFCCGVSEMHQPIYEAQTNTRLLHQLDLVLNEIRTCSSYLLSANMLSAYALRVLKMQEEIGDQFT